jgi:hypothetical protein
MATSDPTTKQPNDLLPPTWLVDDLSPPLASAEKPEAVALVLMRAVITAERDTKPSTSYLLNLYAECLDTVYGDRAVSRPQSGEARETKDASGDMRDKLGTALSEIGSIIEVLQSMDDCANGVSHEALGYLTERLEQSRNLALDAFRRIFKMHPYSEGAAA